MADLGIIDKVPLLGSVRYRESDLRRIVAEGARARPGVAA
jgi:hypothetical protein